MKSHFMSLHISIRDIHVCDFIICVHFSNTNNDYQLKWDWSGAWGKYNFLLIHIWNIIAKGNGCVLMACPLKLRRYKSGTQFSCFAAVLPQYNAGRKWTAPLREFHCIVTIPKDIKTSVAVPVSSFFCF